VTKLERTDDEHAYKLYSILNTVCKPTITYMATVLSFQLQNKLNAYINTCLYSFEQKQNKNTFIFKNLRNRKLGLFFFFVLSFWREWLG
jgi:hypothetical protein